MSVNKINYFDNPHGCITEQNPHFAIHIKLGVSGQLKWKRLKYSIKKLRNKTHKYCSEQNLVPRNISALLLFDFYMTIL